MNSLLILIALNLVCTGTGSKVVTDTSSSSSLYGESASASSTRIDYGDLVDIRIDDAGGMIRMPKAMWPLAHSGNHDGWWKFRKLQITEQEIIGSVQFNFINKPSIRINRLTGSLSINGTSHFFGKCEAYDPATIQKKF